MEQTNLFGDAEDQSQSVKHFYPPSFERFWLEYPRRIAKLKTYKAYKKSKEMGITDATLIYAAGKYAEWCKATGREIDFVKHPTTWLNGGCWDDELVNPNFKNATSQNVAGSNRQQPKSRGEIVAELINNISDKRDVQQGRGIHGDANYPSDIEGRPCLIDGSLSRH